MGTVAIWIILSSIYRGVRKLTLKCANNLPGVFALWMTGVFVAGSLFCLFEEGRGFWVSCYWSAITGLSIGYGDISPLTTGGRWVAALWGGVSILLLVPMIIGVFIQAIIKNLHLFTDIEQKLLMTLCRFLGRLGRIIVANQVALGRKIDMQSEMLADATGANRSKLSKIKTTHIDDGSSLDPLWAEVVELDEDEKEEED